MEKENIQKIFERIRDERGTHANTATRIGEAFLALLSYVRGLFGSFLRKDVDDTAQGIIRFMKGLKVGDDGKGIDDKGNAVLGSVVVDQVCDPNSTAADRAIINAKGFDLYMGDDGKSHMYIDYLTTRVKIFAAGAEVRKVSYSGGTTVFSNAGSTIRKVAYVMDANGEKVIGYKCWAQADDGTTRTMNWWRPGMMAMCQTYNVKAQTEGELANRYYWRLVVAVGQETLEDGRLYDYVVLSNVEWFYGTDEVVPSYGLKLLADSTGKVLTFGGAAVAVAAAGGLTSFGAVLKQDGVTMDDYDISVSGRNYAGYEPAEGGGEPDAPMAGDVIVQVGDQVKWKSRGNVIKLSTSTEDDASGAAPAIAMYYGIGKCDYVNNKADLSSIWKWRDLTFLASPAMTYVNSDNFRVFTDGNIAKAYDVSKRFSDIEINVTGITTTVEETKQTVDGFETRVSKVEQTANGIKMEVESKINGLNDGLIATGINVTSKQITMTAGRTSFRTNSGEDIAVFDGNGLNADLINVKHLWAESEDGTKKVGYFGNCEEDACKVDDQTYAPLFLGAETAKGSNFYVTADGTMHSKNADVEGKVSVSQLVFQQKEYIRNKPYDGAVVGAGNYVMPRLKAGEFRIVKVFNMIMTRVPATLDLSGEDDTVKFLYNDEALEVNLKATLSVNAPDIAELVGFGQYINLENGLKRYLYTVWKYVGYQKMNRNN